MSTLSRKQQTQKRHRRLRRLLSGTADRPRLAVFRSNNHIYAQVIDEMHETGYDGTELGDWGFMPVVPSELRKELDKRSLSMVSSTWQIFLLGRRRTACKVCACKCTANR